MNGTTRLTFESIYRQAQAMAGEDVQTIHLRITELADAILEMSSQEFAQLERAMDLHFSKPSECPNLTADSIMVKLKAEVNEIKPELDKFNQGVTCLEGDRYDEAVSLLSEIKNRELKPAAETMLGGMVQVYLKNGELEKARALAQELLTRTMDYCSR